MSAYILVSFCCVLSNFSYNFFGILSCMLFALYERFMKHCVVC